MAEIIIKDGVEYLKSNKRMQYNPEYHHNHRKPFTVGDLIYMCSMWDYMKKADIALALGKTHSTVLTKADRLRKAGLFEYYKELGEEF